MLLNEFTRTSLLYNSFTRKRRNATLIFTGISVQSFKLYATLAGRCSSNFYSTEMILDYLWSII